MKALKMIFLMIALPFQCIAQVKQVTAYEAELAAMTWIEARFNTNNVSVVQVNVEPGLYGNILYEVETSLGKTVLLSGSRACLPVLGIYDDSHLKDKNLPCGLQFMLDYYKERIDSSFADNQCPLYYERKWDSLINGKLPASPKGAAIAPLISSNWRQQIPNSGENIDAYNIQIEGGSGCSHCKVGCVAVAMGQVLNFWQYPVLTYSQIEQYDWCNMTDNLFFNSPTYEKNRDAIAFLLERCGHYVKMDYGCNSSGAEISKAANALISNFGFHSHTDNYRRFWHCESWWKDQVIDDLSTGRPVIYAGDRTFWGHGHAFICDGYDGDDLFHFNWGWDASYNAPDHFYTLNNPCPKPDTNYKYWQEAIFDARPGHDDDICDMNLDLSDFYSNNPYVFMNQLYNIPLPMPLYKMVPQTMTTLTSAYASSDSSWRTIPAGATAVYQAHEEINLEDGFEAKAGCEFEARVDPCEKCGNNQRGTRAEDNISMERIEDIQPDTAGGAARAMGKVQDFPITDLFPNPTDGPLTMATDGMAEAVFIHDFVGRPVGGWHLDALTESFVTLDVSALRPGAYLLSVTTSTGTRTARFVRR